MSVSCCVGLVGIGLADVDKMQCLFHHFCFFFRQCKITTPE